MNFPQVTQVNIFFLSYRFMEEKKSLVFIMNVKLRLWGEVRGGKGWLKGSGGRKVSEREEGQGKRKRKDEEEEWRGGVKRKDMATDEGNEWMKGRKEGRKEWRKEGRSRKFKEQNQRKQRVKAEEINEKKERRIKGKENKERGRQEGN